MPMHDWSRVDAGIYHAHLHGWISELSRSLNCGRLPKDYYALPEQQAAGFGPDVLTLQSRSNDSAAEIVDNDQPTSTITRVRPKTRFVMESPTEFYHRKKKAIAIRHVSNDDLVAMIEIMSPGNKSSARAFTQFVEKTCYLLEHQIHLLIFDPFPPGQRDPQSVHAAI